MSLSLMCACAWSRLWASVPVDLQQMITAAMPLELRRMLFDKVHCIIYEWNVLYCEIQYIVLYCTVLYCTGAVRLE